MERRKIEEKLFRNQLLGVVGTSALELGVDIGGVCVTLVRFLCLLSPNSLFITTFMH